MAKSEVTVAVDALTNTPVRKLEWDVNTEEDYRKLREEFAKMPKTPVLLNVEDAEREELPGRRYDWLLRSEQSGGTIALHRITLYPDFDAADHNHVQEGEFFYVLEGEVDFTIGNKRMIGGPGTFGYAPPMGTHAFKPVGGKPAVLLHWNMPGGHERMAEGMAKLSRSGDQTPESKKRVQEVHEYHFHHE